MKGYARKNKRFQLNVKYQWNGMAKTNTRKHNKRMKYDAGYSNPDVFDEYEGSTLHPKRVPPVCKLW